MYIDIHIYTYSIHYNICLTSCVVLLCFKFLIYRIDNISRIYKIKLLYKY